MIYARGKYPYKALFLSAREAARRIAPRHVNDKRRRDPWRPIVLRWRRRFERPAPAPVGRVAPSPNFQWFPQFHFHFAAYLSNRTRNDRLAGSLPVAGMRQERVLQYHNWASVRGATPPLRQRQTYRPIRGFYARNHSWSQVHAWSQASPRASWPQTAQPIATWEARRPRPLVIGRILEGVRASAQKEELTRPFPSRPRIQQRWLQMFSLRAPAPVDYVQRRSHESKRLQSQFDRPEEFVWRRGQSPSTVMAENGVRQERSETFLGPPARSIPSRDAAPVAPPTIERAAPAQLTKLDPGLLDRLTNDVIRRVEQRIRIERERRGL